MISIITPTFNRADLVQTTIKSILAQTYTDWELILVDDGSTDDTEAVVQTFLKDHRIQYFKKPNTGQPDSLNVGVSYAKGTFITFLDSDDEAYPNWLEEVTSQLKSDTGIACNGAVKKLLDGRFVEDGLSEYNLCQEKMMLKFTCGSLFIRKDVFEAIGGYDASLKANIQTDLGYRLVEYIRSKGFKIVSIHKNLVQINIHGGPRIRSNWGKVREGSIQFINKHYDFIYKNNKDEIANIYTVIAFSNYKLKNRQQSIKYMLKAINHNPSKLKSYLRVFKYAFL